MRSVKKKSILAALIFFVAGVITLPHYGINWDAINHLSRGQAYLNYFLTGSEDFSNRPPYFDNWPEPGDDGGWYLQNPDNLFFDPDRPKEEVSPRSMYELPTLTMALYRNSDGGHPPLSDILSSLFNRILFGELRLINDIDAYRIYGVLLAASLVGLIFYWVSEIYGGFAGLIAALSLSLYPLFWAESHFNTEKDVPETVYWSFLMFTIWKGVETKKWQWILSSGVFFGLALGTKFNVLFAILVIIPWLALTSRKLIMQKWFLVSGTTALLIGLMIFVGSWPYLWGDPIMRISEVGNFYKTIGTSPRNHILNIYPLEWIFYTTPIAFLILFATGIYGCVKRIFADQDKVTLLFLFWLIVPIGRVVWPGTVVYGGIRQAMEYIPAFCVFVGIGAQAVRMRLNNLFGTAIVLLMFIPITLKLIEIHPNENVYFNQLIGGLAGAKKHNFPYWGFSFGAPYRQGANWLNENAPMGADVAYSYELIPNLPRIFLRRDLNLHNINRSGYLRNGEYAMTLTYQGTAERSYYDMYLEKFIDPVYQVTIDGVAIFKIWKNDSEHLKFNWSEKLSNEAKVQKENNRLIFDLSEPRPLSRLEIDYSEENCSLMNEGYVQISVDGNKWQRLPGILSEEEAKIPALGPQPKNGHFIEPFVGQEARFIEIKMPEKTCLGNLRHFDIYYFDL
ncbi:MAG: hypothetical protein UV74_C0013G0352 [Candidatus Woesebacteria bacterium GW2011_GWB1_43_14]|uniref:Glycosyltransferase RgtA/B/C/D-like domain-containing protein n=1 Tax=Candidatus Woesebacteria bacterium GW2011_GWB1_43_14 TaxID=1618578 RepID=A0A0G1DH96_9BACT|nr:MAG: hypothetical protein UT21_C0001G0062 [Candidatus Woesebacteria bacterium GW2011_GWA1_39_11b]KKS78352.1 MAG: hypothetical protein UV51_C0001G0068 [Candidatus Woesebacteria bacterium GW2011_GWC1_42_9]KKS97230.1 MAG: hypothetical protein UV74_C0013G0352 [Candidatus Woesebacteria bacterium GW2011_GWB1_43_14]